MKTSQSTRIENQLIPHYLKQNKEAQQAYYNLQRRIWLYTYVNIITPLRKAYNHKPVKKNNNEVQLARKLGFVAPISTSMPKGFIRLKLTRYGQLFTKQSSEYQHYIRNNIINILVYIMILAPAIIFGVLCYILSFNVKSAWLFLPITGTVYALFSLGFIIHNIKPVMYNEADQIINEKLLDFIKKHVNNNDYIKSIRNIKRYLQDIKYIKIKKIRQENIDEL